MIKRMILSMIVAGFLTAGLFAAGAFPVTADDAPRKCAAQRYYWKTVTSYVYKSVAYRVKVRYRKPCGATYDRWVTKYRWVKVPVVKKIKVYY